MQADCAGGSSVARVDRREKLALNESYRYYRSLEKNGDVPDLYGLAQAFKNVSAGLKAADNGNFKLTKQLWKRMHQALFDKLITTFPGYVVVTDAEGNQIAPKSAMPDEGTVEYHPEHCRRADDIFRMEIKHLYPGTQYCLGVAWKNKGAHISPADFAGPQCSSAGCFLKPVLLGQEVLSEESEHGKDQAYHQWWDLYWQAYCTKDKGERSTIARRMEEIESVWGNLFY